MPDIFNIVRLIENFDEPAQGDLELAISKTEETKFDKSSNHVVDEKKNELHLFNYQGRLAIPRQTLICIKAFDRNVYGAISSPGYINSNSNVNLQIIFWDGLSISVHSAFGMHINGSFLRTVDGNPIGCYGLDMNNVIEEYLDVKTKKMRPPVIKEDDESITAEFRNGDMLSTPYMSDIVEYFNLLHIEKNIGSINLYFKDENNKAVPAQKFSENRLKFLEQHLNIAYENQNFERADKIKTDIAEIKHALSL